MCGVVLGMVCGGFDWVDGGLRMAGSGDGGDGRGVLTCWEDCVNGGDGVNGVVIAVLAEEKWR